EPGPPEGDAGDGRAPEQDGGGGAQGGPGVRPGVQPGAPGDATGCGPAGGAGGAGQLRGRAALAAAGAGRGGGARPGGPPAPPRAVRPSGQEAAAQAVPADDSSARRTEEIVTRTTACGLTTRRSGPGPFIPASGPHRPT